MTDNEIIKALVCCGSGTGAEACKKCPFHEKNICGNENDAPQKYALDLIYRQKSKIEAQEMDKRQLQSDIINSNQNFDHINGLWEQEKQIAKKWREKLIRAFKALQAARAEIEKLEIELKAMRGAANSYKADQKKP